MTVLSWVNLADTVQDIAATREVAGLGVRNLLTEPVAEVWRMPTGTPSTDTFLTLDFGRAVEVGVVAVFAPRDGYLPPAHLIRAVGSLVSMGADDVFSLPAELMNLHLNRGCWRWRPAAPVTLRYLRLQFTIGAGDDYLQLGRLWVGPDLRPGIGADVAGYVRGWQDAGSAERAAVSGVVAAVRGATLRTPAFSLPWLTQAEADAIEDCCAAAGVTRQVIAAPTDRAKDLVLGRFAAPPAPTLVSDAGDLFRADIALLEDL